MRLSLNQEQNDHNDLYTIRNDSGFVAEVCDRFTAQLMVDCVNINPNLRQRITELEAEVERLRGKCLRVSNAWADLKLERNDMEKTILKLQSALDNKEKE